MTATSLQQDVTSAILGLAKDFHVVGTTTHTTITRPDSAGVMQTIGTASPIYVLQEEPSDLVKALGGVTAKTTWKLYAKTSDATAIQVGDTLTYSASLIFLVRSLDTTDLPGAVVGALEKQPYV